MSAQIESQPHPDQLLTSDELARLLRLKSRNAVYTRRYEGRPLPRAMKIGNQLRWRRSDVDAWLDAQREPKSA